MLILLRNSPRLYFFQEFRNCTLLNAWTLLNLTYVIPALTGSCKQEGTRIMILIHKCIYLNSLVM